jgi:hypothetical protein
MNSLKIFFVSLLIFYYFVVIYCLLHVIFE